MNSPDPENNGQVSGERPTNQQIFLIGLLAIVIVIVIAISILILTRPEAAAETPSPTAEVIVSSSQLPSISTPTSSITPSPRFTFTPKPTRTPTIKPTDTQTPFPTLVPSLTPAFASEFNDQYFLIQWSPELASQLIDILEAYPETLSSYARGADDQGYYDAFKYAVFAQQEALNRFPTASQAQDWTWRLAYNLARTGDPTAGEVYASQITQELNNGYLSMDEPIFWEFNGEPAIIVQIIPLEAAQNESNQSLVNVSAGDNGSSYFWLLADSSGYTHFPLTSDFNFVNPSETDYFTAEIPAIDSNVIGTFPSRVFNSLEYKLPNVFSFISQPPTRIPFAPASPPPIGPDFRNSWEPSTSNESDLQFSDSIFPACPVTVTHFYKLMGNSFTYANASYEINPDPELLAYCEFVVDHSINVWGLEPTIQFMEALLPDWPPETTTTGKDFPEDAKDEWLYRLSIYHALLGNRDTAIDYAETILAEPAVPDSSWIAPAAEFIETYQSPKDIYHACLPSSFCDQGAAFASLVSTLTPDEFPDLVPVLEEGGVTVRSNGFFDFDNDGTTERWVVIRHQLGSPLEFWIISPGEDKLSATYVETLENDKPRVTFLEPISEPPTVKIDPDITFQYIAQGPENEPIIIMVKQEVIFASDRTKMELDNLETILFSGGDPEFVKDELVALRKSSYFTCSYILCPRYFYLLGLSFELLNDDFSAVDAYLELWRDFPDHPFTTMARFKLGSTITPIPTSTQTPTSVITITPTGTGTAATSSPTVTNTPEGYPPPGYPPPGSTPTSTQSGYPYP